MFVPENLQYDILDALDKDYDLANRMMALSMENVSEEVCKNSFRTYL